MNKRLDSKLWDYLTSLKLTIVCLAALLLLTLACTLAQVDLGTQGAVDAFMGTWVVWWRVPQTDLSLPVFPGGAAVGLLLILNLGAAQLRRLELTWRRSGLWIAHAGLILLVAGEFVTRIAQIDTRMAIEEGETKNYVESARGFELAVIDTTEPDHDMAYGISEERLAQSGAVPIPNTPLAIHVKKYMRNAEMRMRGPQDPPAATMGVGANVAVFERPAVASDDELNRSAVLVEPMAGGKSYGTWLVSNSLGSPQSFVHEGRTYQLSLRLKRIYLPYTLTLKKFSHDVYAGTNIPKNFSSQVHLSNPSTGEERDVLIYMNQPLRYDGKAFYQASFGKNDTLSILQVVENPGWLLPYFSCGLVTLGLLVHFAIALRRGQRRRQQELQQQTRIAEA